MRLVLASQDVIHSFFVPALRIKQDAVPGRYETMWFRADRPGRYHCSAPNIAAPTMRTWAAG